MAHHTKFEIISLKSDISDQIGPLRKVNLSNKMSKQSKEERTRRFITGYRMTDSSIKFSSSILMSYQKVRELRNEIDHGQTEYSAIFLL